MGMHRTPTFPAVPIRPAPSPAGSVRNMALARAGRPGKNVAGYETGSGGGVSRADNTRFANVVLPHLDDAYALARWVMGNRADAEDVVQDACLRALRGISGFSGANGRAWMLTIVRHTAYTWLGKNRPAALVMTDDLEAVERAEFSRGG